MGRGASGLSGCGAGHALALTRSKRETTDTGVVVSTDKGWRVDDIVYGGTWDFGNKGKLSDTLKAVIAESAAAPK